MRACAGLQVTTLTVLNISDQDPPISAEVQTALLAALQVNVTKKGSVLGKRTRDDDEDEDEDEDEED